ncbi:unnamed protein product [Paramecium octaurelia]|uniref:Uncharacterized protein n=1 Tax=Paramecium octaurelia TaxID=43137 RepID=A0A8S1VUJ1_PAROT|nr:unnamed protein product [Paramecium octaurelia]
MNFMNPNCFKYYQIWLNKLKYINKKGYIQMKQYQKCLVTLYQLNQYQIFFDTANYILTPFHQYTSTIKPDYKQKIDEQEQKLKKQEKIDNTNDLITQNNNNLQMNIYRIQYVIQYYLPSHSKNIVLMLPNINYLIEKQKFASLVQLLKRMFRYDLQSTILDIDQLIQEISRIIELSTTNVNS